MAEAQTHRDLLELADSEARLATPDLQILDLEIVHLDITDIADLGAAELATAPEPWLPPTHWRQHGAAASAKRCLDLVVSVVLLVLLAPLFGLVALAVLVTSPGSAIYSQKRMGQSNVPFEMLKFRTMHTDADDRLRNDAALWHRYVNNDYKLEPEDDPRLTPIGLFLRRTSLDELPQLINVVRGSMSLVGPRPVVLPEFEEFRADDSYRWVKPGITGPWQVSGRCNVHYPERGQIVDDYVENWTLLADIKILAQTIPTVLFRRGAH